jgi:flagellar basal body-associated protein FliL
MGRAGAGGGGGGHSGGGHSSSRSSGGHHVSSGSSGRRADGGGGIYSGRSSYGGGGFYGGSFYPRPPRRSTVIVSHGGSFNAIISLIIFIVVLIAAFGGFPSSNSSSTKSVPKSTQNRERLESGVGYDNNCIVDNIGWFDNVTKTEKSIKQFYDKTGVQPYIVLNAYDSTLLTDTAKEEYAKKWYDEHIKNESTFLYMYFAEPDTDNDVGYMAYVNGKQVPSVMDSEAIEIFWAYVDKYWYSDMSTDDMFTTIFTKTADRIMTKSTTAADVGNNAIKVIGVIIVFAGIIVVMVLRRKHKAEEAKETEKILNTPLNGDSEADDLLKKYKKGD